MSNLATTFLTLLLSVPTAPMLAQTPGEYTPAPYEVSMDTWHIEEGDRIIVDTKENEGYIFHEDGSYINFEVVTGQRRWVYYIGRSYNASTPNWNWSVNSMHIKGDRMTFGPSGRFLRLYKDGEQHTAYGFHEYGDEEEIFTGMDTRFRSMGCIIVRVPIMNLLVDMFEQNGSIDVITQYGIEDLQETMMAFEEDEKNVEESDEVALY